MSFGARLAKRRTERGLTQAELGAALKTHGKTPSKSVVYGWEKDQHYPRVDQLILICAKLDCSADYLLNGISSSLPFSHETLVRINLLEKTALRTLENVMRAHLGMDAIPTKDESAGAQVTTPKAADIVGAPVNKDRGELDLTGTNRERSTYVQVPEPGRGGKA